MLYQRDTTGTQTDCDKPLSRKKAKQLMRHNDSLTSRAMVRIGRVGPVQKREIADAERVKRAREQLVKSAATGTHELVDRGEVHKATAEPAVPSKKGGLFGRLGKFIGGGK